jgi:hypothetical protein
MFFILQENITNFLAGAQSFGLGKNDIFQVNDLYMKQNLNVVRGNCFSFFLSFSLLSFCVNLVLPLSWYLLLGLGVPLDAGHARLHEHVVQGPEVCAEGETATQRNRGGLGGGRKTSFPFFISFFFFFFFFFPTY